MWQRPRPVYLTFAMGIGAFRERHKREGAAILVDHRSDPGEGTEAGKKRLTKPHASANLYSNNLNPNKTNGGPA